MSSKNVLVFPCGSEVALEVAEAFRGSRHFHLVGASSVDDHGRYAYSDYVGGLPMLGDVGLVPELARVVRERDVAAVFPATDAVAVVLKRYEDEIGCVVVTSPVETAETCLSKSRTYAKLQGVVRVPKIYSSVEEARYPAFVKPDTGHSSIGARRVDDAQELAEALANENGLIALEYLPGDEYTIDCLTDVTGALLYCCARTRERVRMGISVRTSVVGNQEEFRVFAEAVNSSMRMRGAWFVQVRRDLGGGLCLLEVACRPAGSSSLSRARGANLPLAATFDALGYQVVIRPNDYGVTVDRSLGSSFELDIEYSRAYFDYDDCLVASDGVVNAELVAIAYQCVNRGMEIVLLSRHDGDLDAALRAHRLLGLFDRVIHIGTHDRKSDYVEPAESIFIDDSFAERADVARLGVPVFTPDMAGCLMSSLR